MFKLVFNMSGLTFSWLGLWYDAICLINSNTTLRHSMMFILHIVYQRIYTNKCNSHQLSSGMLLISHAGSIINFYHAKGNDNKPKSIYNSGAAGVADVLDELASLFLTLKQFYST